jgi:peptidoglycan/LPS O-acetylase OafA/YrhL
VAGLAVSFPAAVVVHRYVELPLMDLFKKKREWAAVVSLGTTE